MSSDDYSSVSDLDTDEVISHDEEEPLPAEYIVTDRSLRVPFRTTSDAKHEQHLERLRAALGDFTKWQYTGGDKRGGPLNKFHLHYGAKAPIPDHNDHCVCGHAIKENCYIAHLESEDVKILGNCCIRRFLPPEARLLKCFECGTPHRNRKYNFCNGCGKCEHRKWTSDCTICTKSVGCEKCRMPHRNRKYNLCNDCGKCEHHQWKSECPHCEENSIIASCECCGIRRTRRELPYGCCTGCWCESKTRTDAVKWSLNGVSYGWVWISKMNTGRLWIRGDDGKFVPRSCLPGNALYITSPQIITHQIVRKFIEKHSSRLRPMRAITDENRNSILTLLREMQLLAG